MVKDSLALRAKNKLMDLVGKVDSRLEVFWEKEIEKDFGYDMEQKKLVKRMLSHAWEHNLRTGKRLRASFVYYGYLLGGKKVTEGVWLAMEAVELVHTALLIHDDFMDEDKLRRGKITTQEYFASGDKHFGESMAVNTGDAVLCLGYERLMSCGLNEGKVGEAMRWLLKGITQTAFGQAYDMGLTKMDKVGSENIIALHKAKTALYTYETPLMIGAILGGVDEQVKKLLTEYSMTGGVAFQMQDDILGVFGDSQETGKSNDSDLLQGKHTLLTTRLMEVGSEEQKKALSRVWGKKKAGKEDLNLAKQAIKDSGAYDYSVKVARELMEQSLRTVDEMRQLMVNMEAVDYLEGIARYLLKREV